MIDDDDDDEVWSISRRLELFISRNEALGSSILNIESEQASKRSCISLMGFFVYDSLSFEANK